MLAHYYFHKVSIEEIQFPEVSVRAHTRTHAHTHARVTCARAGRSSGLCHVTPS